MRTRYARAGLAVLVLVATPVCAESRGVQLASNGAEIAGNAKSKRIVAVHGPLSDVIAHVSRHFNGEIILADTAMGSRIVTGAYDMDNPALALQTLVSPVGGHVTEVTPWMLIVSAK